MSIINHISVSFVALVLQSGTRNPLTNPKLIMNKKEPYQMLI